MLQKSLDTKLQQKQARETGLCPVREELYSQSFDELIRQVTIMCAERGLLLLRVREELRMAITAYQTLYESSVAYGMRNALMQESVEKEAEARIAQLEKEVINNEKAELIDFELSCCAEHDPRTEDRRSAKINRKNAEKI